MMLNPGNYWYYSIAVMQRVSLPNQVYSMISALQTSLCTRNCRKVWGGQWWHPPGTINTLGYFPMRNTACLPMRWCRRWIREQAMAASMLPCSEQLLMLATWSKKQQTPCKYLFLMRMGWKTSPSAALIRPGTYYSHLKIQLLTWGLFTSRGQKHSVCYRACSI